MSTEKHTPGDDPRDDDAAFEASYRRALELKREARLLSRPYGEWCRDPGACASKSYCPLDPTCGD